MSLAVSRCQGYEPHYLGYVNGTIRQRTAWEKSGVLKPCNLSRYANQLREYLSGLKACLDIDFSVNEREKSLEVRVMKSWLTGERAQDVAIFSLAFECDYIQRSEPYTVINYGVTEYNRSMASGYYPRYLSMLEVDNDFLTFLNKTLPKLGVSRTLPGAFVYGDECASAHGCEQQVAEVPKTLAGRVRAFFGWCLTDIETMVGR